MTCPRTHSAMATEPRLSPHGYGCVCEVPASTHLPTVGSPDLMMWSCNRALASHLRRFSTWGQCLNHNVCTLPCGTQGPICKNRALPIDQSPCGPDSFLGPGPVLGIQNTSDFHLSRPDSTHPYTESHSHCYFYLFT